MNWRFTERAEGHLLISPLHYFRRKLHMLAWALHIFWSHCVVQKRQLNISMFFPLNWCLQSSSCRECTWHNAFYLLSFLLVILFPVLFLQCLCSLLHINKIFEVGISEHLANKLQHMNIDLVEMVLFSELRLSVPPLTNRNFELVSWCRNKIFHCSWMLTFSGEFFYYRRAWLCIESG